MSNFELTELSLMYITALQDQAAIFVTVLFAYLATAYFAGSSLSKSEAIGISVIYTAFQLQLIWAYYSISLSASNVVLYLSGQDSSYNTYWVVGVLVLVMALSLDYLRRKRASNDT